MFDVCGNRRTVIYYVIVMLVNNLHDSFELTIELTGVQLMDSHNGCPRAV